MHQETTAAYSLDDLCAQVLHEKDLENQAKSRRAALEVQIWNRTGVKDEGAETHRTEQFKITVKQPINRTVDFSELTKILKGHPEIPAEAFPVKTKHELDEPRWKAIQTANPELAATLSPAITMKPGKVSVTIVPLGDQE